MNVDCANRSWMAIIIIIMLNTCDIYYYYYYLEWIGDILTFYIVYTLSLFDYWTIIADLRKVIKKHSLVEHK